MMFRWGYNTTTTTTCGTVRHKMVLMLPVNVFINKTFKLKKQLSVELVSQQPLQPRSTWATSMNNIFVFVLLVGLTCVVDACKLDSLTKWAQGRLRELRPDKNANGCAVLSGGRSGAPKASNASLVLFQNDEYELLSDWLQYHAYMFGFSNLHVVDHNSKDVRVCRVLALYKQCGMRFTHHGGSFEQKSDLLTAILKKEKNKFLLPLDADEFVVNLEQNGEVDFDPTQMADIFANLVVDGRKYMYRDVQFVKYGKEVCNRQINVPVRRAALRQSFRTANDLDPSAFSMVKVFYHSDGFVRTDQGNHYGRVKNDLVVRKQFPNATYQSHPDQFVIKANLTILHYNTASYNMMGRKMIRGAKAYGYKDSTNCTQAIRGSHYCLAAKEFNAGSEHSRQYFTYGCQATAGSPSLNKVVDWFEYNALTLEQLVSVPALRVF
jgi:hypothetical protein